MYTFYLLVINFFSSAENAPKARSADGRVRGRSSTFTYTYKNIRLYVRKNLYNYMIPAQSTEIVYVYSIRLTYT